MQLEGLKNVVFDNYERSIFRLNWNRNRSGYRRGWSWYTSLHFLHSTLPHYGLVLNTFSLGCYTSHHIQVVTFPHVPSHTLMLSCLACSRLAAVDRQTVVPSNFSSFYL